MKKSIHHFFATLRAFFYTEQSTHLDGIFLQSVSKKPECTFRILLAVKKNEAHTAHDLHRDMLWSGNGERCHSVLSRTETKWNFYNNKQNGDLIIMENATATYTLWYFYVLTLTNRCLLTVIYWTTKSSTRCTKTVGCET